MKCNDVKSKLLFISFSLMDDSAGLYNMGDNVVCASQLVHKVFPSAWRKVRRLTKRKRKRIQKQTKVLHSQDNYFINALLATEIISSGDQQTYLGASTMTRSAHFPGSMDPWAWAFRKEWAACRVAAVSASFRDILRMTHAKCITRGWRESVECRQTTSVKVSSSNYKNKHAERIEHNVPWRDRKHWG